MTRKEIRNQVKVDYATYKDEVKAQKVSINQMNDEAKSIKMAELKKQTKDNKIARKAEIKVMEKTLKKEAKYYDRQFRKLKYRKILWSLKGAGALLLLIAVVLVKPYVSDVLSIMSRMDNISTDSQEAKDAKDHGFEIARQIADEGLVLLKNDDNLLPLETPKLNVFGISSTSIRSAGGGSGSSDQSNLISLYDALEMSGIEYNPSLADVTRSHPDSQEKVNQSGFAQLVDMYLGKTFTDEPTSEYLTDEVMSQALEYSDTALFVIGTDAVESIDLTTEQLQLTPNKKELLEKLCDQFENVIIVINSGNAMELGFLEEYPQIKAAIWIGTPGSQGVLSLSDILAGNINPSGRLVDTYTYDIESHPSYQNYGDFKYDNLDMSFTNYSEGIYVGYRYFETYFKDDEAGYKQVVQYPFGYGLSYTDFSWEVTSKTFNMDKISIEVKVTNTGKVAGKDVVQLYYSAPYTTGGIEKSYKELATFAKTKTLQPNESQTLTLSYDTRDMASYDYQKLEAYILEKGVYDIMLGKNVHDIVNKETFEVAENKIYKTDDSTKEEIKNLFDYARSDFDVLSRSDFDGSMPKRDNIDRTASDQLLANIEKNIPTKMEGDVPAVGVDNGLLLEDLKGLDFDDPKWDLYIEQFTIDEMKNIFIDGAWQVKKLDRLGVPQRILFDGPSGLNFFFGTFEAASYPTEVVLASTWNTDLAYSMGEAIGMEANAYGIDGWYAPGMNIHRLPHGGRNYEYFSEDPIMSGNMSANLVKGAQSKDILVFMKHFAMNDTETNARNGLYSFADEQTMREMYLKPFEITLKEAEVTGVMSSFVHIGHKWAGGNPELLNDLLRTEWGFDGMVTTDAVLYSFMDINLAIRNGNDIMLDVFKHKNMKYFDELLKEDPVGIVTGLQERIHHIMYSIINNTK